MQFEDILEHVGGYGRYQKCLTWLYLVPVSSMLSWITLDGLFVLSVPEHWCHVDSVANSNLSVLEQRALVSPPGDPSCSVYNISYPEFMFSNYTAIPNDTSTVACTSGWEYSKVDYDSTASTQWNLVCDRQYFKSFILTLQNAGGVVMGPVYGFLADRYGRKRIFLILTFFPFASGILSVLVDDLYAFVLLRIIYASVMPAMYILAFVLTVEIVDPANRARVNGVLGLSWVLGLSLMSLLAYLSRTWVTLALTCSCAFAAFSLYHWLLLESPSWLVLRERYEEAADVMVEIGKRNKRSQDRDFLLHKLKILGTRRREQMKKVDSAYSIFKYSRLRKHFLIIVFCRISFTVVYFGPMYNLSNLFGNEFLNFFLLSVVEIPGTLLFWFLMNRVGRRWTATVGYVIGGLVCLGPLLGLSKSDLIFSMLGKLVSAGLFLVSEQQSSELFPTSVRSFSTNLGKTAANIVTMPIPFMADLGSTKKHLPFILMGCTSIVGGILASFLPETLNKNLPQTIEDAGEFGKSLKYFSRKEHPSLQEPVLSSEECSYGTPNPTKAFNDTP